MIIKATLAMLVLILIIVIVASYYVNKEGFEDISNGYLSNVSKNLGSAINTVPVVPTPISDNTVKDSKPAATDSTVASLVVPTGTSATPTRTDVIPEVSISGSGYDAMTLQERSELLKDIQKLVRNEILAHRNTSPIISGETRKTKDTDCTAQGKEYEESCYKGTEYRCPKNPDGSCPPVPDMTQYIKKDAIPCWGCTLDY